MYFFLHLHRKHKIICSITSVRYVHPVDKYRCMRNEALGVKIQERCCGPTCQLASVTEWSATVQLGHYIHVALTRRGLQSTHCCAVQTAHFLQCLTYCTHSDLHPCYFRYYVMSPQVHFQQFSSK